MVGLVQKLCLQLGAPKSQQAADHITFAQVLHKQAAQVDQQEHAVADFALISTAAAA